MATIDIVQIGFGTGVYSAPHGSDALATITATFSSPTTAGNSIVALACNQVGLPGGRIHPASDLSGVAIADTQGNTWTQLLWVDGVYQGFQGLSIFVTPTIAGGADTVTIQAGVINSNPIFASNNDFCVTLIEYSGLVTPSVTYSAYDQIGTATRPISLTISDSTPTSVTTDFKSDTFGDPNFNQSAAAVINLISHSPAAADVFLAMVATWRSVPVPPTVSPVAWTYQTIENSNSTNGLWQGVYSRAVPITVTPPPPSTTRQPIMFVVT